jgi:glycosyltransferase involved in cell wall biosynthesis
MGFCRDVHSRIADAALYVMSSDFEGMPNALMEAMSIGLPCISTDCPCGGPKMLIENRVNGILVPVRDVSALEREMDFMLSSPDKAKEMGENAVKIRDMLSSEGIAQQWLSFIETVVKS